MHFKLQFELNLLDNYGLRHNLTESFARIVYVKSKSDHMRDGAVP